MMVESPIWRSLLYVPVINERFIAKAHERGADAIILDLEDSVPMAKKAEARRRLADAVTRVGRGGADVLVRINRPLRLAVADLEAAVIPGVTALMLPKCAGPEHVRLLAETVTELETERRLPAGTMRFVVMIESAAAFGRMEAIAAAHPRVVALVLGAEDFADDVAMTPDAETLFMPKQQAVLAARAAGVIPLGFFGTVADYKNPEALRATIRRSKKFGFEGAPCVHPALVPIFNEEFAPSEEEIAAARRIVDAYTQASRAGVGAIEVDGMMVDVPVVRRAERVLLRTARIHQKKNRSEQG
jgi:citrate lyase subunit beta/citryl-CoA lyase